MFIRNKNRVLFNKKIIKIENSAKLWFKRDVALFYIFITKQLTFKITFK
jgi:hypothetical protein